MATLCPGRPALLLSAALALAACGDVGLLDGGGGSTGSDGAEVAGGTTIVERDVEAPEVFQATEAGLWDGRPSLGGVWVAHPDVKEPERVLIRNETNDKFVIGALFRRERDNPGPRLQVSSDAAAELGMLAGQPVRLNVTALKREETAVSQPEPDPAPAPAAEEPVIQPAEAALAAEPAPSPDAAATVDDGAPAAEAPAPGRKGFLASLFGPRTPAEPAATADEAASAGAPVASVETAALDAPAPATAPAAAPKPASTLDKPFIQIGIFSVEQNAENAATSLRRDGILPTVRKQSSAGKTFWRVIVGPAGSSSERAAILKKVKALGYADAYFVTN